MQTDRQKKQHLILHCPVFLKSKIGLEQFQSRAILHLEIKSSLAILHSYNDGFNYEQKAVSDVLLSQHCFRKIFTSGVSFLEDFSTES